jgi:multimeric flavodoxin WrbA
MPRLLAINGCYRENSVIDQAIALAVQASTQAGATTEVVYLRDLPVRRCLNCRKCTATADSVPEQCVIRTQMHTLLAQIQSADGFILASPANLYTAAGVFKRFMARLTEYAHQHENRDIASSTRGKKGRQALLISTSATPGLMGRFYYSTRQQLEQTARLLGARQAGCVFVGMVSDSLPATLPDKSRRELQRLAVRLVRR